MGASHELFTRINLIVGTILGHSAQCEKPTRARARAADTGAKGGLGRGLHPERWGRVAFVWPEKPFRAVSDVYPVTYFPGGRLGHRGGKGAKESDGAQNIQK